MLVQPSLARERRHSDTLVSTHRVSAAFFYSYRWCRTRMHFFGRSASWRIPICACVYVKWNSTGSVVLVWARQTQEGNAFAHGFVRAQIGGDKRATRTTHSTVCDRRTEHVSNTDKTHNTRPFVSRGCNGPGAVCSKCVYVQIDVDTRCAQRQRCVDICGVTLHSLLSHAVACVCSLFPASWLHSFFCLTHHSVVSSHTRSRYGCSHTRHTPSEANVAPPTCAAQ